MCAVIKFCAEDEMNMDENVKKVKDRQLYEEQEHESGDPIQGIIHNDVKHAQIEELLENVIKIKILVIHPFSKAVSTR